MSSRAGRPGMPDQWKAMMGNPGRRPIDPASVVFDVGIPPCPSHLDDVARKEWERIAPLLETAKLMSPAFMATLAMYCVAWSRWVMCEERVKYNAVFNPDGGGLISKTKNGFEQFDYWFVASNKAQEQLLKYQAELCLSPVGAARAKSLSAQGDLFANDPLAAFQRAVPGQKTA
jgi:P27 family predicted phage terminase small subunit